jgi:hypothetical protein
MRNAVLLYAAMAQATILIANVPALAGYGAVAYDQEKRKQGVAWNEDTQQRANEAALRACGSDSCKLRFGCPARQVRRSCHAGKRARVWWLRQKDCQRCKVRCAKKLPEACEE